MTKRTTLSICAGLLATLTLPAIAQAPVTVTVDPSVEFQTWEGWGTSLAWWAKVVGGFPEPARTDYLQKAFDVNKGLGLNIVRYNIGGGEAPQYLAPNTQFLEFRTAIPGYQPSPGKWDWSADANQRYVLAQAIKMGANQLEAFSNSPPYWMTLSGSVTGNHDGKDNLDPRYDAAFADYLTAVVRHFRDQWGVTFRDLEPINEPSGGWGFGNHQEGCHVDRPHQNAIVGLTVKSLTAHGLSPVTTATASDEPSIGDADKTFPFYDAVALGGLSKINTHSYGGGDRTQLSTWANSAGKDLWLSEDGDGDPTGMSMCHNILDDIRGLHPSAWVTWQVVDNAVGWGFFRNPLDNETDTAYTVNRKFYVMGQFTKFLRPGCRLIAVADPNSLAALDPRTGALTVVTVNFGDATAPRHYDLTKFTRLGKTARVTRTSPTENLVALTALPLTGKVLDVTLSAHSVTTFVIPGAAYTGLPAPNPRSFYRLVNVGSGQDADVAGGVTTSAAACLQSVPSPAHSQNWSVIGRGDGYATLVNRTSGLVMDVNQAATTAGADVIQYPDDGAENQQWRLEPAPGGTVKIRSRHSGLLLGVTSKAPDSMLVQVPDDGSPTSLWRLVQAH